MPSNSAYRSLRRPILLSGTLFVMACQPAQITTMTVYDTPQAFVRLETDQPLADRHHSHPAYIPPDIMAAALTGITIEEPKTRMPLYDDLSLPRQRQALTAEEIARLAPLLSLALEKATPEELVTFYESFRISGGKREVTSGGMFVDGEELHVLLSNLRSGTHYAPDPGVADQQDDRLTPMRSIAPQQGRLSFTPAAASRDTTPTGMSRLFHWDRRELIILYKMLEPRSFQKTDDSIPAAVPHSTTAR